MASLNSLQIRALAAQTTSIRNGEDAAVALRIVHTSTVAVTSVVVNADTIVLTDADGANTITLSTSGTMGSVVDKINALANWKAKLLDSTRAQVTTVNSSLITGTKTANSKLGEFGYDILMSNTNCFTYAIRCTYDRTAKGLLPAGGHRVKLASFNYNLNVGAAAADMVKVLEWDPVLRTETQIFSAASVDSTGGATTGASFDFSKAPITAKEGNDLIVLVTDASAITSDAADNFLQAVYVRE